MAIAQVQAGGVLTSTVSRNVRAMMAANGVSQMEMARAMGLSQTAVSKRLRGLTPWDTNDLEIVARVLRVRPEALLTSLLPHQDSNLEPAGYGETAGHPFVAEIINRYPDIALKRAA